MGVALKVGIGLFTGQVPAGSERTFAREYRETLELVRIAEAVGFDSAWVSEHHGSSDGYLPSLLPMLAAFAAVTERIELGTGVVLAPLHDPLRLAEDAAVVDQLSNGRLILGLGIGWREEEFRMFDVPIRERAIRTEELVEICRRAWTGERFSFAGRASSYDRVRVTPPPARPGGVPIFLGGYDPRAVRRAGRIADGYIGDSLGDEQGIRSALEQVEQGAREAGRDPRTIALALHGDVFVSTHADAFEVVRPGLVHSAGTYEAWDQGHDTPEHDSLDPVPPAEEELRRSTSTGTPERVAAALLPIVDGFGDRELHLIVRLHYPGMNLDVASRAVELFAGEVLPALRSR